MILQLKYMPIVMNPARIASSDWKSQKCYGLIRLIFKRSSVTPDFFYVFHLILLFSTCSRSFKKICSWELLGAMSLSQSKAFQTTGSPCSKYVVYATACVYRELYGKIADRKKIV